MTDVKVEPDRAWLRVTSAAKIVVVTAVAVLFYAKFDQRMTRSEESDKELVETLQKVQEALSRIGIEFVSVRAFENWLTLQRADNKDRSAAVIWNPLPR